jgi:hypothetical protein
VDVQALHESSAIVHDRRAFGPRALATAGSRSKKQEEMGSLVKQLTNNSLPFSMHDRGEPRSSILNQQRACFSRRLLDPTRAREAGQPLGRVSTSYSIRERESRAYEEGHSQVAPRDLRSHLVCPFRRHQLALEHIPVREEPRGPCSSLAVWG